MLRLLFLAVFFVTGCDFHVSISAPADATVIEHRVTVSPDAAVRIVLVNPFSLLSNVSGESGELSDTDAGAE